jgi:biopolymer transport protein ExbD
MRTTTTLASDINVTPLVDVCLVLLIIFMVVIPTLVTGMPVDLPKASTAAATPESPLHITINADRTLYLNANVIREEELASALQREKREGGRPVIVRAEKTLLYGDVIRVLDLCRRAGFTDVGLAADKLSTDRTRR